MMVAVCSSSSAETAGCGGWKRDREPVWLTPGWPVLLLLSESHPGTTDVEPSLLTAKVPAGVWLWTSN